MNKNCAFTICTRSYIGLAETLKNSYLENNEDFDFYIIFCDGETESEKQIISGNEITGLGKDKYEELAFKYNVTEFCTCLKPFGFLFFFNKGYDKVAYFDPDIMFFSRFNELYEDYSVFLTPHIINVNSKFINDWGQEQFLKYGVYNCGFIGLNNDENGKFVAKWWSEQLLTKAFADPVGGMYTDQKWIDMVPSFIDLKRINIIKNYGCDFAPWNYSERTVNHIDNNYYAVPRDNSEIKDKLVFVHYSAYDYKKLLSDDIIVTKYSLSSYPEIDILLKEYRIALLKNKTLNNLNIKYKYGEFQNGIPVLAFQRRLYRAILETGASISNPFSCDKDSFFILLKKSKLISNSLVSQSSEKNIKGLESKNKLINNLYKVIKTLLGIDKYILFLRKSGHLAHFENQTFLLNDRF